MKRRSVIGAILGSFTMAGCGSRADTGEKSDISPTSTAQRTLKQGVSTKYQADLWEITGDKCAIKEELRYIKDGELKMLEPAGSYWCGVQLTVNNLAETSRIAPEMGSFVFVSEGWTASPLVELPQSDGELRQRDVTPYIRPPGYVIDRNNRTAEIAGGGWDYLSLVFDVPAWPVNGHLSFSDGGETTELGIKRLVGER